MAQLGTINFHVYLVGDDQAYDYCVVRDPGESVYLHFGIYDFEGNADDIPAWAEEEGVPCIHKQVTARLVTGPSLHEVEIEVPYR